MSLATVKSAHPSHPLVDTHCHLDALSLAGRIDKLILDAKKSGLRKFVVPGVAPEGWSRIQKLAEFYNCICPAYGLHPMFADRWSGDIREKLLSMLPNAVAVGEIGLDYQCREQARDVQAEVFRQQLRLAVDAGLPVLIHCRDAFRDLLAILEEETVSRVGGIMHAFSGSPEIAIECIRLGLLISVAGPITYKNAVRPVKVVEKISISNLVLETDSPDLTPEPHRGMQNEPAFLPLIASTVASVKSMSYSEVAEITTFNATKLLSL